MNRKNYCIVILLWIGCLLHAQSSGTSSPSKDNKKGIEEDSVFDEKLPEVIVYPQKGGLYKEPVSVEKNYYSVLQRQVYKIYPYAKTAATLYNSTVEEVEKIEGKREKRRYIKYKMEALEEAYEKQLKRLTKKEGQLFSKLINRQTKKTTYEIIQQFRSGWSAFWWNLKANIYDISLKAPYDPENDPEDHFIELILQQAFHSGKLQP